MEKYEVVVVTSSVFPWDDTEKFTSLLREKLKLMQFILRGKVFACLAGVERNPFWNGGLDVYFARFALTDPSDFDEFSKTIFLVSKYVERIIRTPYVFDAECAKFFTIELKLNSEVGL